MMPQTRETLHNAELDNEKLGEDMKKRQESYSRRERNLNDEIVALTEQLNDAQVQRSGGEYMADLRNLHRGILNGIGTFQARTSRVLQEQERDLLRAFRSRLYDVQKELDAERSKKNSGAEEWIKRNKELGMKLESAKQMAEGLERENEQLKKANLQLKTQYRSQEDDREFLVRQLVSVKKENVRLRQEVDSLTSSNLSAGRGEGGGGMRDSRESGGSRDSLHSRQGRSRPASGGMLPHAGPGGGRGGDRDPLLSPTGSQASTPGFGLGGGGMGGGGGEQEKRFRDTITRLNSLLDVERRKHRGAQKDLRRMMESRSEVETLLLDCLNHVKTEVQRRRLDKINQYRDKTKMRDRGYGASGAQNFASDPSAVPTSELAATDREKVLEMLLSQERVIALLYDKTFPSNNGGGAGGGDASNSMPPIRPMSQQRGGASSYNQVAGPEGSLVDNVFSQGDEEGL